MLDQRRQAAVVAALDLARQTVAVAAQWRRTKVFGAELPHSRQQINRQFVSALIVFMKPVFPSRVAGRVIRATEPALVTDDQATLEAAGRSRACSDCCEGLRIGRKYPERHARDENISSVNQQSCR